MKTTPVLVMPRPDKLTVRRLLFRKSDIKRSSFYFINRWQSLISPAVANKNAAIIAKNNKSFIIFILHRQNPHFIKKT
jgi:hypothetical protein